MVGVWPAPFTFAPSDPAQRLGEPGRTVGSFARASRALRACARPSAPRAEPRVPTACDRGTDRRASRATCRHPARAEVAVVLPRLRLATRLIDSRSLRCCRAAARRRRCPDRSRGAPRSLPCASPALRSARSRPLARVDEDAARLDATDRTGDDFLGRWCGVGLHERLHRQRERGHLWPATRWRDFDAHLLADGHDVRR